MAEESLAFYPLILAAMIALGYDALSAVAVIMLGAGIGYRIVILIAGVVIGVWYLMRYAGKVLKDPSKSLVADMKEENEKHFLGGREAGEAPELTGKRKLILTLFLLSFVAMIVGVIPWSDLGITGIATRWWWFGELSVLFMVMGAVHPGRRGRLGNNRRVIVMRY